MPARSPEFNNTYVRLPERFYARVAPTAVPQPGLIRANERLAFELGIDPEWLKSDAGIQAMAGNAVPEGAEPIAMAYAGHQFGSWNPQLGDGRALLLGEVVNSAGERFDIQLKGSGRTPWSRGGDGKAPLGPVLREYMVSEAMAAMGIPTTRSLAAVYTGEEVYRNGVLPGAVLARVARSHIRIGTLQFLASRKDTDGLRLLTDHVIQRHYPDAARADNHALAMFDQVATQQAKLVARWQLVGFIHGVMNTDNMLLSGETIDYGPCAFMDEFDPATVYSSIDHGGRYAYRNQPAIAHWNLTRLAETLLPLVDDSQEAAVRKVSEVLDDFPERFTRAYQSELNRKLGLADTCKEAQPLGADLFTLMAEEKADFTLTFRKLAEMGNQGRPADPQCDYVLPKSFKPWLTRWQKLSEQADDGHNQRTAGMLAVNPVYIPRNHRVEEAINSATRDSDFSLFHRLVDLLANPYHHQPGMNHYAMPPTPEQVVTATFCGT